MNDYKLYTNNMDTYEEDDLYCDPDTLEDDDIFYSELDEVLKAEAKAQKEAEHLAHIVYRMI